jgi:hypothetical protein
MNMQTQTGIPGSKKAFKVFLWVLIALYTFILPDAILIYRQIVSYFGNDAAGKIPVVIVVTAGIAYALVVLLSHKSWRDLLFLIPCGVIAFLIMKLEPNPNKHIHIPEYVLMAWLIYAALSRDYKGSGILLLVFIYASLLGVVDELEQGINPARFYGWSDMLVNTSSALIGVFTILGLKKRAAAGWDWLARLKDFKALIGLCLFGFIGAVIMCGLLFQIQAGMDFWVVYPRWLWIGNIIFLVLTLVMSFSYLASLRKKHPIPADGKVDLIPPGTAAARCWIFPMLAILFYMHALVMVVSISGVKFV